MRITRYPVRTVERATEEKLLTKVRIIFVTVTPIEREAFLLKLRPLPAFRAIIQISREAQTYFIGVFGKYVVAYTRSSMGAVQRDSASNVTNDAVRHLRPVAVIMTGIAFGLNRENKNLGDVLISETVVPYEVAKLKEKKVEFRGPPIRSGVVLYNRFRDVLDWDLRDGKGKSVAVHEGPLLSGEKLVDKKKFVLLLEKEFPKAIGGEMEGSGVASVCDRHKVEWIIVKSICDWGYGKHDDSQRMAANSSADYAHHVFNRAGQFNGLLDGDAPEEVDSDAIGFSAKRGTPLWVLNRLRANFLTAFVRDLRNLRLTGLPDDATASVRLELYAVCRALGELPDEVFTGTTLNLRMLQFIAAFERWAGIQGQGGAAATLRDRALARLNAAKLKLSKTVRESSYLIGVGLSAEQTLPVVAHLSRFFAKHDNLLRELAKTRNKFKP